MPDVASRLMLTKMSRVFKIPIKGFVDANPSGINILNVYSGGAPGMCHNNGVLAVGNIEWFGVFLSDMVKHDICRIVGMKLSQHDYGIMFNIVSKPKVGENPDMRE